MGRDSDRPLTRQDKEQVFRKATRGLLLRYADAIETGMSDAELAAALTDVLGIFGGSGGPDSLSISFAGSGLRIWGGWSSVNHVTEPPLFAGKATIATARELYGIADPDDLQLPLL